MPRKKTKIYRLTTLQGEESFYHNLKKDLLKSEEFIKLYNQNYMRSYRAGLPIYPMTIKGLGVIEKITI